jgi:Protein of unknown function (DUF1569)
MENLFDPAVAEDVKQRILRLNPESERQWGKMTLSQTLAHCTSGVKMAMGTINPKRAPFPVNLIGPLIKPLVLGDGKPMRRNSPSSPELFPPHPAQCDFERERAELIAAMDAFASRGASGCSQHPHPFFGRLKPLEWATLMHKHLDHHLRQFGA